MDKGLAMVIGMSIAYLASLLGLVLAWRYYNKYKKKNIDKKVNQKQNNE